MKILDKIVYSLALTIQLVSNYLESEADSGNLDCWSHADNFGSQDFWILVEMDIRG